jgi:outer membrane protein OmpA-like peptidoglycan-associated protein
MGAVFGWVAIALVAAMAVASPSSADPSSGTAEDRCGAKVRLRGPIYDYATGALQPGVGALLDELAAVFRERCGDKLLIIEAHAMELPTSELNQRLSELRALTIRYELAQRGIAEAQMLPAGMGSSRPEVPASDPDALSLNRRVTFRVAD